MKTSTVHLQERTESIRLLGLVACLLVVAGNATNTAVFNYCCYCFWSRFGGRCCPLFIQPSVARWGLLIAGWYGWHLNMKWCYRCCRQRQLQDQALSFHPCRCPTVVMDHLIDGWVFILSNSTLWEIKGLPCKRLGTLHYSLFVGAQKCAIFYPFIGLLASAKPSFSHDSC